jgi:hypothetical protein
VFGRRCHCLSLFNNGPLMHCLRIPSCSPAGTAPPPHRPFRHPVTPPTPHSPHPTPSQLTHALPTPPLPTPPTPPTPPHLTPLTPHPSTPPPRSTPPAGADPEILERRYPVVLRQFRLRPGSGGSGRWRGGDGVIREVGCSIWCWTCVAAYVVGPMLQHMVLGCVL